MIKKITLVLLAVFAALYGYNEILRSNARAEHAAALAADAARPICGGPNPELTMLENSGKCRLP